MKKLILWLTLLLIVVLFWPHNSISYIKDDKSVIKLSRVERGSFLIHHGTYFTTGYFSSLFSIPKSFVRPQYESGGADYTGCFDLIFEFKGDTTIVYQGSFCDTENLNSTFRVEELANAFGEKNWFKLANDTTGRYKKIDCNTY